MKTLISTLIACLIWAPALNLHAALSMEERNALLALYTSTQGDNWTNRNGWDTQQPGTECTWYGLTCQGDHVFSLNLNDNHLTGPIPPEIGNLSKLWYLDLGDNRLSGPIPPQLGQLEELWKLYLDNNELTGPIPPALGELAKMQELYLYNNQLSCGIPVNLGALPSLKWLWVSGNQLSGPIPGSLGALPSLERLYLYDNHLTGLIPRQLANLDTLKRLRLHKNRLIGPFPLELKNLPNLDEGGSDFRWNHLYTSDEALRQFLDTKQTGGDWQSTQSPGYVLDLNADDRVDVGDVVALLQVLTRMRPFEDLPGVAAGALRMDDALYMLRLIGDVD